MKPYDMRLEAINELLDTIQNALPKGYIISKGIVKHEVLRITMNIKDSNQIIVKWIPIDPRMKWDYEREMIKCCVIESFTILNNEWLKTKLNDITTEEIKLYTI
jgi:hypothetical protein